MKKILLAFVGSFFTMSAFAGSPKDWSTKLEQQKIFIENKGQFNIPNSEDKALYAVDNGQEKIYFAKNAVYFYYFDSDVKLKDKREIDREAKLRASSAKSYREFEEEEHKERKIEKDLVKVQWLNSNSNVNIIPKNPVSDYQSYSFYNGSGQVENINYIKAYQQILYQNLYNGIDVLYEFHPTDGIKYSIILHPHADVSLFKMNYSHPTKVSNGDLKIKTRFGNITEHAPVTFYQNSKSNIASSFNVAANTVSFNLDSYDANHTVVIDPWVQSPTFGTTTWHCVWECEKDALGNVYIIGGGVSQSAGSQMQLKKYNSTGTLQWTYNTPYDTSNAWLGTFATDDLGNSYVTAGSVAKIQKINTTGGLVWNNGNPGGLSLLAEFWNISFNCDQTQLVIGGTGGILNPEPYIYNVNMNTGNVLNSVKIHEGGSLLNSQEVRSITACGNAKYYWLSHDSIGWMTDNFSACPGGSNSFKTTSGLNLGYKCENYRFDNSGIMAIRSYGNFVFTHRGNQIQKRNFNNAAVVATAAIAGGAFPGGFGGNSVENSGIDIDNCGNIYVGSKNSVVKYDQNLNILATYATTFNVYDVHVTTNGDIIACGSTGNSGSANRSGYIQQITASACAPVAIVCCDANICQPNNLCVSSAPINLSGATAGGTWTGTGITNASLGTFDPGVAGPGVHTIHYSLACGSDSITINVQSCQAIPVCINGNGSLSVTGTGPFTWYAQTTYTPCVSGFSNFCGFFTAAGAPVTTFTNVATGTTYTPSSYPVYVLNAAGDSAYVLNAAAVPPCVACALTPTVVAQSNVSCNGGNNGAATVNATGGTGSNSYSWAPSGGTGATAMGLSSGSYTVTITNAGCTTTQTVNISQPTAVSATVTPTAATCGQNNGALSASGSGGTGTISYSWLPSGSGSTISNLSPGTYTLTASDVNSCSYTTTATIAPSAGPSITQSNSSNVSCFGGNNGTATVSASGAATLTYSWTPSGGTAATATGLSPGNYSVTVTDGNGCTTVQSFTISQPSALTATISALSNVTCNSGNNGSASVSTGGGTGTPTYTWSPSGGNSSTASGLAAGVYTVTINDANACATTQTVSITEPTAITTTITPVQPNCGQSNGSASASASGGTGVLTYTWLPSGSGPNVNNLGAGTYTCVVFDASGCSDTSTVALSNVGGPSINSVSGFTLACNGDNNGTASVTATGGSGPLSYTWAPSGGNSSSASNLTGGTYTVAIADQSGCLTFTTVTVTEPSAITASVNSTATSCTGSTGSATVTPNGGAGSYTYQWLPSGGTSATASNLASGNYTVIVTDANSCSTNTTVTITMLNAPNLSLTNIANVTCFGSNNGSIIVNGSGGTGSLTYSWSPNVSSSQVASNLAAGVYTVTLSDQGGCSTVQTYTVTEPNAVSVNASANTNTVCAGSNVTLNASGSGGTGTINYNWLGIGSGASQNFVPAGSGTYTVVATDANNCTATSTVSIVVNPLPIITAGPDTTVCSSAVVNLFANGAGTNNYNWAPSTGLSVTSGSVTTASINNTTSYTVTGTDANGCSNSDVVTVTIDNSFNVSFNANPTTGMAPLGVTFNNTSTGTGSFIWNFGDGSPTNSTSNNPAHEYQFEGSYQATLYGVSSLGCLDSASITIVVEEQFVVVIPNVFTPNGDGLNDDFHITLKGVKSAECLVYDRWGLLMYKFNPEVEDWPGKTRNGKICPDGSYYYILTYTKNNNEQVKTTGYVLLNH